MTGHRITTRDASVRWLRAPDIAQVKTLGLAAAVSCASVGYAAWVYGTTPGFVADFDQMHAAARAVLAGESPYTSIGPARAFPWEYPFYYPLPAVLLILPLGFLSPVAARLVFIGVGAALFGYALARLPTRWGFVALASQAYVSSVLTAQWSLILTAAALLPALRPLGVVKPNIGAAVVSMAETPRELVPVLVIGGCLLAASFAIQPGWVFDWLEALRWAPHRSAPVMRPWGFLLLAAWFRWRRPEARLLGTLALVPQTPGLYEGLLFFAVARTRIEYMLLVVLTSASYVVFTSLGAWQSTNEGIIRYGQVMVPCLFLPALVMVLRRANEAR